MTGLKEGKWMELAQHRVEWQALVFGVQKGAETSGSIAIQLII